MNVNEVIKFPILSEKTYAQMGLGTYTFAVDKRTNKVEIKKAVEFIFDVKVSRVNVINVERKATRVGKFNGFVAGYKKAIVTLADGQINIFPEEAETPQEVKADKSAKASADKEISDAEQKAADKIAAKLAEKEAKAEAPVKEVKAEPKKEEAKTETKETEAK